MNNSNAKTTVIILGTIHLSDELAPNYIKILDEVLTIINPKIICAELSPEQLDGTTTCNSKPEYICSILPYARKRKILIVPIQPNSEYGKNIEEKINDSVTKIKSDSQDSIRWQMYEKMAEFTQTKYPNLFNNNKDFKFIQNNNIDDIQFMPWYQLMEYYFPSQAELWEEWNQCFLNAIEETIKENINERILITVGLSHKYWLWNKLKDREDIKLFNYPEFISGIE